MEATGGAASSAAADENATQLYLYARLLVAEEEEKNKLRNDAVTAGTKRPRADPFPVKERYAGVSGYKKQRRMPTERQRKEIIKQRMKYDTDAAFYAGVRWDKRNIQRWVKKLQTRPAVSPTAKRAGAGRKPLHPVHFVYYLHPSASYRALLLTGNGAQVACVGP